MTAHDDRLAAAIRNLDPAARRAYARVMARWATEGRDGDTAKAEFWTALGLALAAADVAEQVTLLDAGHGLRLLGDLPAEAADDITKIEQADQDRIAQWPSIDLPDPEDAA